MYCLYSCVTVCNILYIVLYSCVTVYRIFFFRWRYIPLWALACRTILLDFRNNKFLLCGIVSSTPNPQPGGPGYPFFVWVITLDLSGMGGPTSSIRYRQHSSQDHVTTQTPPQRQSKDIFGGYIIYCTLYIFCILV